MSHSTYISAGPEHWKLTAEFQMRKLFCIQRVDITSLQQHLCINVTNLLYFFSITKSVYQSEKTNFTLDQNLHSY